MAEEGITRKSWRK